jgi:outer membrane receptor protein involved in Fe transport
LRFGELAKTANAQVGLTMPHGWEVALLARNVWDDRGINWLSSTTYEAEYFGDPRFRNVRTIQRPRTIGLRVSKKFE